MEMNQSRRLGGNMENYKGKKREPKINTTSKMCL